MADSTLSVTPPDSKRIRVLIELDATASHIHVHEYADQRWRQLSESHSEDVRVQAVLEAMAELQLFLNRG